MNNNRLFAVMMATILILISLPYFIVSAESGGLL